MSKKAIFTLVITILAFVFIILMSVYFQSPKPETISEENSLLNDLQDLGEETRQQLQDLYESEELIPKTTLYEVTLVANWNPRDHFAWIPSNPHFSPFFVWSYSDEDPVFKQGGIATRGVEEMAETGAPAILAEELKNLQEEGAIDSFIHAGSLLNSPGEKSVIIEIDKNNPRISLVSMIAPSPDWFVAAQGIELFVDGEWVDEMTINPTIYDAGTDNGEEFNAGDVDTNPKIAISPLGIQTTPPIASFVLRRIQ